MPLYKSLQCPIAECQWISTSDKAGIALYNHLKIAHHATDSEAGYYSKQAYHV